MLNKKPVPEVGKTYKHYDDGKVRESRQYESKILRVVPLSEAGDIIIKDAVASEVTDITDEPQDVTLLDAWKYNLNHYDWIFSPETDYLVEAEIVDEVANPNWYARTKYGDWFSLVTVNYMTGGILDVDNELTKSLIEQINDFLNSSKWN